MIINIDVSVQVDHLPIKVSEELQETLVGIVASYIKSKIDLGATVKKQPNLKTEKDPNKETRPYFRWSFDDTVKITARFKELESQGLLVSEILSKCAIEYPQYNRQQIMSKYYYTKTHAVDKSSGQ